MNRSDFIKVLGLSTGGLLIPANNFVETRSVNIYDNYVRGLMHYSYPNIRSTIHAGDQLTLRREKENPYDSFAISIYHQENKLGYIAAYENIVLANMLDAGVELSACVSYINKKDKDIYEGVAIVVSAVLIVPNPLFVDKLIAASGRADDNPDAYRLF